MPEPKYFYDASGEDLRCTNAPDCPICHAAWLGIRSENDSLDARPVADCSEGHAFAVKTMNTAIGQPSTFTVGDQLA
jgi:hypothetical protein